MAQRAYDKAASLQGTVELVKFDKVLFISGGGVLLIPRLKIWT
jgi:hypothetical protein